MFSENFMKDRVVLITGGGSGLGLVMAQSFARYGATVLICSRNEEKLKKAMDTFDKKFNQKHRYFVLDVRDATEVEKMHNNIFNEYGKLDILINNAAGNFLSLSEKLSPKGFKIIVDIVLHGTFHNSLYYAQQLIKRNVPGHIINIVTTYAETGSAFVVPSAAAKAGVLAMTRSLAYEWADYNIRVNAIAPGPFPTKGAWQRLIPDDRYEKLYLESLPMKRFGNPRELANLVLFLASDLSPYITGECITIDGGERLKAGQFNILKQVMNRDELNKIFDSIRRKK